MTTFIESARTVLQDYNIRVKERLEEQAENEDGEEASEDILFAIEDDQNLLSDMNKAFHSIFKTMGTSFLPHWAGLIEFYSMAVVNPDPTQRQWAICIYDDVLEFCGPESWQYKDQIIQPLIDGMQDDVPANRQAAVYGVGVAAHKGGENWSEFVAASLETLFQVTQRPNARADDDIFATENASAAIAKILHYNASKVANWDSVAAAWIDTLPITNDEEATPYAYAFLSQLIEQYVYVSDRIRKGTSLTFKQAKPSCILPACKGVQLRCASSRGRDSARADREPRRRIRQGAHSGD
jgi:hypothetical protein